MGKFNSDKAEMTCGNPDTSGLPKPTDYKKKKINTEREICIYIEAYDRLKSQQYRSSKRVQNSWIMLDFGVPMVRRCLPFTSF